MKIRSGDIFSPVGATAHTGFLIFRAISGPVSFPATVRLVAQAAVFAVCGFSLLDENPRA